MKRLYIAIILVTLVSTPKVGFSHSFGACVAYCLGCPFTAAVGLGCQCWGECIAGKCGSGSAVPTEFAEYSPSLSINSSPWLIAIQNCMQNASDLDSCVQANTALSLSGRDWDVVFDEASDKLTITNTGNYTDTAMLFVVTSFDLITINEVILPPSQSIFPLVPGSSQYVDLKGKVYDHYTIAVASYSGAAINGDAYAVKESPITIIPTLSEWAIIILTLLLLVIGVVGSLSSKISNPAMGVLQ